MGSPSIINLVPFLAVSHISSCNHAQFLLSWKKTRPTCVHALTQPSLIAVSCTMPPCFPFHHCHQPSIRPDGPEKMHLASRGSLFSLLRIVTSWKRRLRKKKNDCRLEREKTSQSDTHKGDASVRPGYITKCPGLATHTLTFMHTLFGRRLGVCKAQHHQKTKDGYTQIEIENHNPPYQPCFPLQFLFFADQLNVVVAVASSFPTFAPAFKCHVLVDSIRFS